MPFKIALSPRLVKVGDIYPVEQFVENVGVFFLYRRNRDLPGLNREKPVGHLCSVPDKSRFGFLACVVVIHKEFPSIEHPSPIVLS